MGSLRKKTYTKPLPTGAELFVRKGQQLARWKDRAGRKKTAETTTSSAGELRVVIESKYWLAKYRDGAGVLHEISTSCKDKAAAQAKLSELERRAELVRSGVVTASQDAISDHRHKPLTDHFGDYLVVRQVSIFG